MSNRSTLLKGLGAIAAMGLLVTLGLDASAQEAGKKAPAAKAASACKGLAEAACKADTAQCTWVAPKKGKQKAYCRLKPAKKK